MTLEGFSSQYLLEQTTVHVTGRGYIESKTSFLLYVAQVEVYDLRRDSPWQVIPAKAVLKLFFNAASKVNPETALTLIKGFSNYSCMEAFTSRDRTWRINFRLLFDTASIYSREFIMIIVDINLTFSIESLTRVFDVKLPPSTMSSNQTNRVSNISTALTVPDTTPAHQSTLGVSTQLDLVDEEPPTSSDRETMEGWALNHVATAFGVMDSFGVLMRWWWNMLGFTAKSPYCVELPQHNNSGWMNYTLWALGIAKNVRIAALEEENQRLRDNVRLRNKEDEIIEELTLGFKRRRIELDLELDSLSKDR
ncbi:hypothetical protein K438DRAFT_1775774 [Mycena galopus ATCC 62051]|nr:hypothetical protein K438DRAFT_1775774 [Mycena galopus ATCC 62051]